MKNVSSVLNNITITATDNKDKSVNISKDEIVFTPIIIDGKYEKVVASVSVDGLYASCDIPVTEYQIVYHTNSDDLTSGVMGSFADDEDAVNLNTVYYDSTLFSALFSRNH